MSRQGRLNRIDCHVVEFILSKAEGLLAITGLQLGIRKASRDMNKELKTMIQRLREKKAIASLLPVCTQGVNNAHLL